MLLRIVLEKYAKPKTVTIASAAKQSKSACYALDRFA